MSGSSGTGVPIARVTEGSAPVVDVTALITEKLHIVVIDLAYTDTSGVVMTLPADCVVMFSVLVKDTVWDVKPNFTVGIATDLDSLVMQHEHSLDTLNPAFIVHPYHVTAETAYYATWDQKTATQGAAQLIVFYYQR